VSAVDELALEAGSGVAREHGRLADLHPPVLHAHDRYGGRIDEVEFHPSWHGLLRRAGRIRCARQHDDRDAGRWRRMSARRAQVVHLSTNERRFPRARLRPGGLSCFAVPRVLPDGTRNAIRLQRLKNKLANRANASAEIEYDGALGWAVGAEGRGYPRSSRW
jgi:hypothetical protein